MLEIVEERRNQEQKMMTKYAHAGESDSDDMLLMANTQSNNEQTYMWYLNLGCSNHMTGNKK